MAVLIRLFRSVRAGLRRVPEHEPVTLVPDDEQPMLPTIPPAVGRSGGASPIWLVVADPTQDTQRNSATSIQKALEVFHHLRERPGLVFENKVVTGRKCPKPALGTSLVHRVPTWRTHVATTDWCDDRRPIFFPVEDFDAPCHRVAASSRQGQRRCAQNVTVRGIGSPTELHRLRGHRSHAYSAIGEVANVANGVVIPEAVVWGTLEEVVDGCL